MKNKRGLSAIIASVLLVLLVFVVGAIVWTTYKNLVDTNLNKAESCLDTFGKIEIVGRYTCSDFTTNQFQFSIEKKDIEVDEIIVSLNSRSGSKTISLTNESTNITGLRIYPNIFGIVMPGKNSAITYVLNLTAVNFLSGPDEISVVPVVGGEQCEAIDTLTEIDTCVIPGPDDSEEEGEGSE